MSSLKFCILIFRFLPSETDGRLYLPAYANVAHLALPPASDAGTPLNRLALMLPGSFGVPQQYTVFTDQASSLGFHALTLMWESVPTNEAGIVKFCQTAARCEELYRYVPVEFDRAASIHLLIGLHLISPSLTLIARMSFFGTGVGVEELQVTQQYSTIIARTRSALQWLHKTHPSGGWGQFLDDGQSTQDSCTGAVQGVCWGKITFVGYSQSASPAAWSIYNLPLDRVAMVGGPQGLIDPAGRARKAKAVAAFVNAGEKTRNKTTANWDKLGLSPESRLVSRVPINPIDCSAIFGTSVLHHRSDMMDLCLYRTNASGYPVGVSIQSAMPAHTLTSWPFILGARLPLPVRQQALSSSCSAFESAGEDTCADVDWVGLLTDLLSPDDVCPGSTRYIDLRDGRSGMGCVR